MKNKIKKYRVGIFSDKQARINAFSLIIYIVGIVGVMVAYLFFDLQVLPLFAALLCGYIAIAVSANELNKIAIKFYKDCDLNYFIKETNKVLMNPKLHSESINYINILRVGNMLGKHPDVIDFEKMGIYKPTTRAYYPAYYTTKFTLHLYKEEFEEAKELLRYVKDRKSISGAFIKMMENDLTAFLGVREIENVEKVYKLKGHEFKILTNLHLLMRYYLIRNNIEKAKEYASKILEHNSQFDFYNNESRKILGILGEHKEKDIPKTVMVYLEEDNKYLMLYRNKKEVDINKGKYIGVGGHVEENESENQALVREVKEETGLDLLSFDKKGIVYFVLNGYIEEMHVYTSSLFTGNLIECNEGELSWVDKDKILELNLWEGDIHFVNKILNNEDFFIMKLIYNDDVLIEKIDL